MEETSATEVLTRAELDLAYCSEKLGNLHNLLRHVLSWQKDLKAVADYDNISPELIEKGMEFDLMNSIMNTELREVHNYTSTVQATVVDIRRMSISSEELSKWHSTEEIVRQAQDHILEMKIQLAKLQITSLDFNQNEWDSNSSVDLSKKFKVSGTYGKPRLQMVEEQHILRMLEKSLARELDLEKQLAELKQNEEDIKLKLRLTEQVAQHMEEAAEDIWGRFLEADNSAEVLMGVSKEMVGRFQVARFHLDNSIQREKGLNVKLQFYATELQTKEDSTEELKTLRAQFLAKNNEAILLSKKVSSLEEKLQELTSQLKVVEEAYEGSQEQLAEMDGMIESMRETIDEVGSRAETAEVKVAELTDANAELTEEINLLKGSNDSNNKKVSLLEKQTRDLELKLQHARTSSEASQEQLNMLYTAIWDMETLVDELKQKVSNSENKAENAEEQSLVFSEANSELNKEVEFLRIRNESLETTLDQVTVEKMASAKDISMKTNVIMDMVVKLTFERERVQKQLHDLSKENTFLKKRLKRTKKDESSILLNDTDQRNIKLPLFMSDSTDAASPEKLSESSSDSQVEETLDAEDSGVEDKDLGKARKSSRLYVMMAVFIVIISVFIVLNPLNSDDL